MKDNPFLHTKNPHLHTRMQNPRNEAWRKRSLAMRERAPSWLRGLGIFALVRAVAYAGIAWWWLSDIGNELSQAAVVTWAVANVLWELLTGVTLIVTGNVRMPWGLSLALGTLAFLGLSVVVILLFAGILFAMSDLPDWQLYVAIFDSLVRVVLIAAIIFPAIVVSADWFSARYSKPPTKA